MAKQRKGPSNRETHIERLGIRIQMFAKGNKSAPREKDVVSFATYKPTLAELATLGVTAQEVQKFMDGAPRRLRGLPKALRESFATATSKIATEMAGDKSPDESKPASSTKTRRGPKTHRRPQGRPAMA